MGYLYSEPSVLGDEAARDKALLIGVKFGDSPGGQARINQIGVQLAVSVHGGDRAVVSDQGGVPFLEEQAQVSVLEMAAISAVGTDIISELAKGLPEGEGGGRGPLQ